MISNSLFHSEYGADLAEEIDAVVCGLVIGEPGVMGILLPIVCRCEWDAEFVHSIFVRKVNIAEEWKRYARCLSPELVNQKTSSCGPNKYRHHKSNFNLATHHLCGYVGLHAAMQLHAQF